MVSYIPELTNISFSAISTHLKLFSESLGLPNTSANSPLLGVSPELYYFVIGASRLGLAVPPNDSDFAPASSLKAKILEWKDIYGLETAVISTSSTTHIDILRSAALYVVAIYLLLTKMTTSELGMGCQGLEELSGEGCAGREGY
jgi:hypothetical protein